MNPFALPASPFLLSGREMSNLLDGPLHPREALEAATGVEVTDTQMHALLHRLTHAAQSGEGGSEYR